MTTIKLRTSFVSERRWHVVGRRPIHESSHKREREEMNDEEDSRNVSGRLIRRKCKKMMSAEPSPKIQTKPFQGIKIIDLEDLDIIPLP